MSSTPNHQNPIPTPLSNDNDQVPLRYPALDDNAPIWIPLAVLIPIIFAVILCVITGFIYRYKKRQAQRNAINSSITPIDHHNVAVSTIFYNPQNNSIIIEEPPPSYDLISETKKDLLFTTKNKQFQLSPIKYETTESAIISPSSNSNYIDPPKDIHL